MAHWFLEAEEMNFRWDARTSERWLGGYESDEEQEFELDRIAICRRLDGRRFAAMMIVDGDGSAHGMLGCRSFGTERAPREALAEAH